MQRKVSFVESEFYHLYNRGVEKRNVFISPADYKRFMMLLYLANSEENTHVSNVLKTQTYEQVFTRERKSPLVDIGAFVLMPNHFHILATQTAKNGLSRFMQKLQTGYSMYFNTKNDRSGSLFQGSFRSEYVGKDRYLKYLLSYIHLNPAKLKDARWKEGIGNSKRDLIKFIEAYPYSSLKEFLSGDHVIINLEKFPDYLSSKKDITHHLTDWFSLPEEQPPIIKVRP